MQTLVIKVGRKRKLGKRKPCGRLTQEDPTEREKRERREIAIAHPERQGVPEAKRLLQNAGTPFGRLNIGGIISDNQFEAGQRYARAAKLYQQVIDCPPPSAKAMDAGMAGGKVIPIPVQAEEVARRMAQYNQAFESMYEVAGHRAARAVARVAVYGEWLPANCTMEHLQSGLTALLKHYGLTDDTKSGDVRNRQ